ncbi:MAG: branched-chain amino acid ABC transporter permease [Mycobacteriaceae bacterium]
MQQLVNVVLNGVSQGLIYAAFALALVLIFRSTRIINFAQGSMAMLTTFIALAVIDAGLPYWLGFLAALASGFVLGGVTERVVVRRVEGGPELNAVIVTLGLFVAFEALAALVFGSQFQSFPSPVGLRGFQVGGINLAFTPNSVFVVVSVAVVLLALLALFRFTDLGLTMRAAAFNQEVARLLGVKVGRLLTLGWGLAAVVGSVSGLLVAGGGLVFPAYMQGIIVFGFVAAVLGGLDSPVGAVVGGLLLGIVLSVVSGYVDPTLVTLSALALLIVVLLIRPAGLFSSSVARRV